MEFSFVAGTLALDLVNTEVVVRGRRRDLLQTPADLVAWWEMARSHHPDLIDWRPSPSATDTELLEAAKALRAALRRLFTSLSQGGPVEQADIDRINRVLSSGYEALERTPDDDVRAAYRVHDPGPVGVLLPIALSALRVATGVDRRRLHSCTNDRCVLLFYDTTKSATRRWCSLGCLHRARSAERYRQMKRGVRASTPPS